MAENNRILIVDDDVDMAETIADSLIALGFNCQPLSQAKEAVAAVARGEHDALVTDLRMPGVDGLELVKSSRDAAPQSPVIVMTAFSGIESAIESIRLGAYHYLTKPFKMEELALFLRRALAAQALERESAALKRSLRSTLALENIVGETAAMRELGELIRRVADTSVPVLVLGETGTGKGLVARALHAESARTERPFVAINCAALPEALLESELFGHAKGAFTGAAQARVGLYESAHGGTLFLDEIGEMSPALQAKLLHVLETGRVRPVGETRERAVDVRVIAATHRDLRARVQAGTFRSDLLYRLDVVSIEVPALRFRPDDIPRLIDRFLRNARLKHPIALARVFSAEALATMLRYDWPGNVRELEHMVERAALLCRTEIVAVTDLPRSVLGHTPHTMEFGERVQPLREMQKIYARWAMEQLGGKKTAACEALDIDIKTLNKYLDPSPT